MSISIGGRVLWSAAAALVFTGWSAAQAETPSTSANQLAATQTPGPTAPQVQPMPGFEGEAPLAHARAWASVAALYGRSAASAVAVPQDATGRDPVYAIAPLR